MLHMIVVTSLVLVVAAGASLGQTPSPTPTPPALPKMSFPAGKKVVEVPFEISGNWMVVSTTLNGSQPLKFILDTGAQATVLQNAEVGASLGLKIVGRMPVRGAGTGPAGEVSIAEGAKIAIGGIEWSDVRLAIPPARTGSGPRPLSGADGVVGRIIFSTVVVEVDWEKQIIRFHDPATFKYEGQGAVLPLTFDEGMRPYTTASIALDDGDLIPIKVVVDTGGSHNLILDVGSKPEIKAPEGAARGVIARGASGDIFGVNGQTRQFKIGDHRLTAIPTMFPDRTPGLTGVGGRQGSVGAGILRKFRVIYDYARQRMIIEPNRFYSEKFPELPPPRVATPPAATSQPLQELIGKYGQRTITLEGGDLYLQRTGGQKVKMVQVATDEFSLELVPAARIKFVRDTQRRVTEIQILSREGTWENVKRNQ